MPLVHNRHHGTAPPGAVYVGRGTPWGNPYRIGPGVTRGRAIELFERHVLPTLDLAPLLGKDLVCSCKPARCHADSLLKAAEELRADRALL